MLNQIPHPKPDFQLQQLDNEIVLFHPSQTRVLYLNQSASLVWSLCDGKRSTAEIIRVLSEAYPDAAADISADVQATLKLFLENGCIQLPEITAS
jgi:coenzyme PQQ biosynthesis protein PqqD